MTLISESGGNGPRVAFHIRRRLSVREQARLDVADIRCTPEAVTRAMALGDLLAYAPPEILVHELGDLAPP